MDPHRISELRSLALHRLVAERCRADATLIGRARNVLHRWIAANALSVQDQAQWLALFERSDVLDVILTDDEVGRQLRSSSPFSVLLSPQERWRIWKEIA